MNAIFAYYVVSLAFGYRTLYRMSMLDPNYFRTPAKGRSWSSHLTQMFLCVMVVVPLLSPFYFGHFLYNSIRGRS